MLADFTVLILDSVLYCPGYYGIRQSLSALRAKLSLAVIFESVAIRWIVIGVGDITTKRVLPAILAEPRSLLAGIVTRTPAKANPYGVPAWTSLEVALAEQECDAVYVASPVVLHAAQTIASLHAGRHVLCEKPMAMNYEEALSMQRTADEVGRILGIAYYRRMYPKVNRALELIRLKAIGEPETMVRAARSTGTNRSAQRKSTSWLLPCRQTWSTLKRRWNVPATPIGSCRA